MTSAQPAKVMASLFAAKTVHAFFISFAAIRRVQKFLKAISSVLNVSRRARPMSLLSRT
jgi:hypothetical protein